MTSTVSLPVPQESISIFPVSEGFDTEIAHRRAVQAESVLLPPIEKTKAQRIYGALVPSTESTSLGWITSHFNSEHLAFYALYTDLLQALSVKRS